MKVKCPRCQDTIRIPPMQVMILVCSNCGMEHDWFDLVPENPVHPESAQEVK